MGMSSSGATAQPFNVNTAASQGLQSAMGTTAAGQGFYSPAMAGAYMNPYTQNVTQSALNTMNQARQSALNDIGAQATRSGAFGGSRHGLVESQANKDFMTQAGQLAGNLQYQGYNQALQQASADQQMRMNAAQQLGGLANLGFGMGQTINQNLAQQGALQQALQQMALDKASQQYQGYTQSPYTALSAATSALGATPYSQTQTSSQGYNPGLMDYLGMGLTAYSLF